MWSSEGPWQYSDSAADGEGKGSQTRGTPAALDKLAMTEPWPELR